MGESQKKDYRIHKSSSLPGLPEPVMVFVGGEVSLARLNEIAQEVFPDTPPDRVHVSLSGFTDHSEEGEVYIVAR